MEASGATSNARIGYLVYRLERRLRARLDQAVRTHGVTATEAGRFLVVDRFYSVRLGVVGLLEWRRSFRPGR